ncbi:MAG TPA: chemotaxis protein CheA [Nitrospirae bacterium]|nr:chemotaxis protein CheA [Nitrospirota bacterium]
MTDEIDEMEEIIIEFIAEAEESLDKIEPLFVELEQKGEDKDLLNDIFRSMHTIKGAAGFLGFQLIVSVAHSSENIMKKLRDREISLSKELMDVILKSIDMLRLLLEHLKAKDGMEEDIAPLVKELEDALNTAISGTGIAEEPGEPVESGTAATVAENIEPREEPETAGIPESAQNPDAQTGSSPAGQQETAEVAQAAKDNAQKPKETPQNLRVDIERIDKVMDLAGEVVLVRNRLLNISKYFNRNYSVDSQTETLMETVSFLDRVTSDLQIAVMKMRMQPIKKVLSKFPRLVRDISASVNKEVELIIHGEGTEVDKSVIEHIGDPMTHILRNSIDHGLESTEERIAKGKPPKGTVIINIFQKGNQIVIEVSDDGQGIDIEKLKKKAIEKGLLTEEDARKMSDDAATDIIFMPGSSTKEFATELSGRGVGMDVVKTNISLLNGYVEVSTEKDAGTTFKICIPLTLAIIQALMVEVSGAKYAIPLSPIEETRKVSKEEIENITGQNVIVIRDKVCPLFELNILLGNGSNGNNGNEPDHKYIVVIAMGDRRFCIAVDSLLGQEEVVIKTLEGIDTTSSYVLGATITGDGKVVFILDVAGMSRKLFELIKL